VSRARTDSANRIAGQSHTEAAGDRLRLSPCDAFAILLVGRSLRCRIELSLAAVVLILSPVKPLQSCSVLVECSAVLGRRLSRARLSQVVSWLSALTIATAAGLAVAQTSFMRPWQCVARLLQHHHRTANKSKDAGGHILIQTIELLRLLEMAARNCLANLIRRPSWQCRSVLK
jgi:hypothetical protein